jgi:hypothetical protein
MRAINRVRALCLALFTFLLLGGGTAFASYVVSSNGQIGPNTVSGHHPRSGDHANLIPGTVDTRDLASGAVTTATLAPGSVNAAKVAAANKDGAAGVPSLRTLGTGARQAMPGNATPGGPPTGAAAGALSGTYPNPGLDVTGGPCANGQALTDVSAQAALTCKPGVYSDANDNVVAGPSPFGALTTGVNNVGVGPSMFTHDTSGQQNAAVGRTALQFNSTGTNNAALGTGALRQNTTGSFNAASGDGALVFSTTGSNNAAFGADAMAFNSTGSSNTALGANAGINLGSGNDNVEIANEGVSNESDTIRIGTQGTQTKTFLAGVSGATTGGTASPVVVDSNGQLGTTSSSRRFKRDIHPIGGQRRGLMALRPVSFHYRRSIAGGQSSRQFGLIAEQVARVYPNLVVDGRDGKPSAVAYQELPALELAQLQHEQVALRAQRRRTRSLASRARAQRARLQRQEAQDRHQNREITRLTHMVRRAAHG